MGEVSRSVVRIFIRKERSSQREIIVYDKLTPRRLADAQKAGRVERVVEVIFTREGISQRELEF